MYLDFIPVSPYSFLYPCSFWPLSTVLYCCTLFSIVDTRCFGREMWVLLHQVLLIPHASQNNTPTCPMSWFRCWYHGVCSIHGISFFWPWVPRGWTHASLRIHVQVEEGRSKWMRKGKSKQRCKGWAKGGVKGGVKGRKWERKLEDGLSFFKFDNPL